MIFWIILTITLLLSVVLIAMVLLQPSKGGGLTGAFGGIGGSLGSTFGARRTLEALGKGTTWTAILIAVLCLVANMFFVPKTSNDTQVPVTSGANAPANAPVVVPPPTSSPPLGGTGAEGTEAPATTTQTEPAEDGE